MTLQFGETPSLHPRVGPVCQRVCHHRRDSSHQARPPASSAGSGAGTGPPRGCPLPALLLQVPFHPSKPGGFQNSGVRPQSLAAGFLFPRSAGWLTHRPDAMLPCAFIKSKDVSSPSFSSQSTKSTPIKECTARGSRPPLLHFQDGGVCLHDGHDDPVDVVLQAEVDLLLLLNRFHELVSGDRADLSRQGFGEGG